MITELLPPVADGGGTCMMILWPALVSLGVWVRMAELSVGSTMERPVVSVSPVMKVNVSSMSLPLMISELSRTMVAMPGDCGAATVL